MQKNYDVAAYVWPAYTGDELRSRIFWPEGIGEWETVKNAGPKFEGHTWPRKPLWGYVNEADPYVMEMQINAAADHGINVFIYDWYWYDRAPFLENCLNDGYLKAKNNDRVRFYLMWANHNVPYIWDIRNSHVDIWEKPVWYGALDRSEFEIIANRLIEKYFSHPSYYRIDGKPVFSIYDLKNLLHGLGGIEKTCEAIHWFRKQCEKAVGGIHLQLVMMYNEHNFNYTGLDRDALSVSSELMKQVIKQMGIDSITHYQNCHFLDIDRDFNDILTDSIAEWNRLDKSYDIPYFPHVSVGWDSTPRYREYRPGIVKNNTPEAVEKAFRKAKEYADAHPAQPPLITINSWNEWTETSYLQPDDVYGYGYLEAAKRIFTPKEQSNDKQRKSNGNLKLQTL